MLNDHVKTILKTNNKRVRERVLKSLTAQKYKSPIGLKKKWTFLKGPSPVEVRVLAI
jgi:hypothetical protein